jgi:ABC-type Fe3+-hydroxamate transport system substrate-binding protein
VRVVSLVPSLTEAVAAADPGMLVGATDYCTHPAGLEVSRVGGSKYPSVDAVLALRPDLVLANVEENREQDVVALRAAGIRVHVTYPRTLTEAFAQLREVYRVLEVAVPEWLPRAEEAWAHPRPGPVPGAGPVPAAGGGAAGARGPRALVPVWRRPWVVVGGDTFAGDLLTRLGIDNVYGGAAERYPRPSLRELRAQRPDLLVLPDEPYPFTAADGPGEFPGVPYALVSGRHLTWYGPSLAEALPLLAGQLAQARAG